MKHQATLCGLRVKNTLLRTATLIGVVSTVAGCGSDGGGDTTTKANVLIKQENNYTSKTSLTLTEATTAAAADITINWGAVTQDLQCHDISPQKDLNNVTYVRFKGVTQDVVEQKLASGKITGTKDVDAYFEYNTDGTNTSTKLSTLKYFETKFSLDKDYAQSDSFVYVLVITKGTAPATGARTMMFLRPDSSSSNMTVDAPSGCGLLDFKPDLHSPQKLSMPAAGPWVVDWSGVATDNEGNDILFAKLDNLFIGFVPGKTVADLEALEEKLDIDALAKPLWQLKLTNGQTHADLKSALDPSNAMFSGFNQAGDGVWAIGVRCMTCQSPAPPILAIVEPTK